MKLTIKKTVPVEQEINVEFPFYTRRNNAYYQVIDQFKVTRLITGDFQEITKSSIEFALGEDYRVIDKSEFEEELKSVKNLLNI